MWGPRNRFHWIWPFCTSSVDWIQYSAFPGRGTKILSLQGKLTKTLTKLYDGLVDNLRTILQLICPGKALAKTLLRKPSMVDIATLFKGKFSLRYFE